MKNLKIAHKLYILVFALMAGFGVAMTLEIRGSASAVYSQRYEMLRTETESAVSVLKQFYARQQAGELTEAQARQQAFAVVNGMKYDPDGYFFGYDYDVNMVFHYDQSKVGKNLSGKPDPNGKLYREELVKLGRAGGGQTDSLAPSPISPKTPCSARAPMRWPSIPGGSWSSPASISMISTPRWMR